MNGGGARPAPQLARIQQELEAARRRAHDIAAPLTAERWGARPTVAEWSVAECLIHLNMTSRAFLPLIREAITQGRDQRVTGSGPYRRDLMGWLLCWLAEPPIRVRVKTTAPFVPGSIEPKGPVLDEFDSLQAQLVGWAREGDGLDLGRLRVSSPFDPRIRYNLYSCLRIIPAHQRQHLSQAERVVAASSAR